jgi:hypothetical protein
MYAVVLETDLSHITTLHDTHSYTSIRG